MATQTVIYKGVDAELWDVEFLAGDTTYNCETDLSGNCFPLLTPSDAGYHTQTVNTEPFTPRTASAKGFVRIDKAAGAVASCRVLFLSIGAKQIG